MPANLRETVRAFVLGVRECQSDYTTHYPDPLIRTYDAGRALGRFLTRQPE